MNALEQSDATLHFRVDGPEDGPALVFINSLGTDFRIWDAVAAQLPAGLRIIRYDKRGHGLSDCPESEWGLDAHIDDLQALLDRLDVKTCKLVGLSIGGLISLGLIARQPERVAALTLMDTAVKIGTVEIWNERIAMLNADGFEPIADAVMARWFPAEYLASAPELALYRNMLTRTPQHGYLRSCVGIRDADFTAQAQKIDVPTLAICGSEDGSTPPDTVRATADLIPGARFELIQGAGHVPCVDKPTETSALLNGFLKEISYV